MLVDSQYFDNLAHLAQRIEDGNNFASDLRLFEQQLETVKSVLYQRSTDRQILALLDRLPIIQREAHRPSFLEKMISSSGREMYGNYKNREIINRQVQQIAQEMAYIRRLLEDDLV